MDFYGAAEISEVLDKAKAKALTDVVFSDTVSTSPPFYFDDSEFKITTDRPDGVGAKKSEKGQSREKEEEQQITVVFARTEGTEEGEEGGDDGCEFKPVKPEKPSKASLSSLLTAAIGPAGGGDDGEGETIVGPSIELTIYLPSKESITVRVGEDATAKKCIEGVIRQQNGQGKKPALRSSADKYELRMVEEDGSVDTDLPPLDAQRLVKSFGDTMFALCLKPGAADEKEDVQSLATAQVGHLLKVHLPHGLGVLSEKVEPSMSLMQVFESVFRRLAARVKQLFIQQDYYFRPPGVSAQPNLSGGYEQKYELQHTIKQLNISEVELAEKVYADRPVAEAPAILEEEEAVVDDELTSQARLPLGVLGTAICVPLLLPCLLVLLQAAMFRLNDMTAAQMTEYDVTKTNEKNHKTEVGLQVLFSM
uniref:CRIM domain-containing protein n=1 Tax=Palpitomonas bilix TaxID=652834 RepID=A0A7S3DLU6_9EUKA|mmetsp:Transcript_4273/g.8523  ORF Transcript_4273/g.8523 Transcript_4273/m.8523 type:complete len:422 (+) Transcript_4273:143-1408(+)